MKKVLSFFFILIVSWATNLLSYSAVFLTNKTKMEFDIEIAQTGGEPVPLGPGGWIKNYTANTVPADLQSHTILYNLARAKFNPGTYYFSATLKSKRDPKNIAGFHQKIEKSWLTSTMHHSAGGNLSPNLPDTKEAGTRHTLWHMPEYTTAEGKAIDICIAYERYLNASFEDDISITLTLFPQC